METVCTMNGLRTVGFSKLAGPAIETRRRKLHRFNSYNKSTALPQMKDGAIAALGSKHKPVPFTPLVNIDAGKRLFVNGKTAQWFIGHNTGP